MIRRPQNMFLKAAGQDRARQGGGRVVATTPQLLPELLAGGQSPSTPQGWFGPLKPLDPIAPPQVAGRRNDFLPGWNITTAPRAYEPITFRELRALGDGYDLLRLVIETRKDQMCRLKWNFRLKDPKASASGKSDSRIKKYEDMFTMPDRVNFWSDWLRMIMEDLLVLDAPAVHIRRTLGGDIWSLDPIDGATIKPIIDDFGRRPEPPFAAYQQVLHGYPAVNYSAADLIYRPRNVRTHKFFGYSPVEQIIMTVQIALRRQLWQLAYFTDGNIPDSLIGVPSTWTPDQIRQFQDWFDSILSGNTQRRRGATFVPGEVAKSYVPTKEAEIFGLAEEWLAKVTCFAFGVSPQPFLKMMNRATAETSVEEAVVDGLQPLQQWVANLINSILIQEFDERDIVFDWLDDREQDPQVQMQVLTNYVKNGIITINEARAEKGLDPDESPEADLLNVITATGVQPLNLDEQISQKQKMQDAFPPPPPVAAVDENGKPVHQPGEQPAPGQTKDKPKGGAAGPKGKSGKSGAQKSAAPDDLDDEELIKTLAGVLLEKAEKSPAEQTPLSLSRPVARRARTRLARAVSKALEACRASVERQLVARLAVGKAEHDANDPAAIAADLDLSDLNVLIDATQADLEKMVADGGQVALAQLGVTDREQLVDQVNDRAVAYARDRAAELVGKRVLDDGTIIDNPDPKWSITQTTRDSIQDLIKTVLEENLGSDEIIKGLEDDFAFSTERATMVARTEVAFANSAGAMTGYRAARADGVVLKKQWIVGPNPCDVCETNAEQGAIDLDEDFESGDDATPAHPNCECATIPVVEDGGQDQEGDEE